MAVAEIAQKSQILRQPIAVPRQQFGAIQHPGQRADYLVNLARLISIFIPMVLEIAQFASNPVHAIAAVAVGRKVILGDIQVGPDGVEHSLIDPKVSRAIRAIRTFIALRWSFLWCSL